MTPDTGRNSIEEWRSVNLKYLVSSFGRVRHIKKKWCLKPVLGRREYRYVQMDRKLQLVHRIVARAFLGKSPKGKNQVNHKDLDKGNNCYWNLEYVSQQENMDHAILNGVKFGHKGGLCGEGCGLAKLTDEQVSEIRRRYKAEDISWAKLGLEFGVTRQTVGKIIHRRTWSHI